MGASVPSDAVLLVAPTGAHCQVTSGHGPELLDPDPPVTESTLLLPTEQEWTHRQRAHVEGEEPSTSAHHRTLRLTASPSGSQYVIGKGRRNLRPLTRRGASGPHPPRRRATHRPATGYIPRRRRSHGRTEGTVAKVARVFTSLRDCRSLSLQVTGSNSFF